MIEPIDLYVEMREACGKVLDAHGIKREHMNFGMLISRVQIRNAVVRAEYFDVGGGPGKGESASRREVIRQQHGISMDHLNSILYADR